jgi:hypothetical protein
MRRIQCPNALIHATRVARPKARLDVPALAIAAQRLREVAPNWRRQKEPEARRNLPYYLNGRHSTPARYATFSWLNAVEGE